jgi:uncharacterized protein YgfB (UPF0149 family)
MPSDEALIAVIGHELYELNQLRRLCAERGGRLSAGELHGLIAPGATGNLHDEAWDEADRLVVELRRQRS